MTLLSTMSATADGKSYPTSRSESVSRAADGVTTVKDFHADIRMTSLNRSSTLTRISHQTLISENRLGASASL